jgi:hypothetical protein
MISSYNLETNSMEIRMPAKPSHDLRGLSEHSGPLCPAHTKHGARIRTQLPLYS